MVINLKNSTKLAVCSLSTALGVLMLFLGGITMVLAYAAPMFLGLIMIMLKRTFGTKSAWITFIATSLLSFILVTDKECMMMYVIFFGYYPIVREYFTKIKNKAFRIITKLIFFNIMMILCQVILIKIFGIPFLEDGQGKSFIIVFALLMNILFLVYELMIEKVTLLYIYKLEKRIKKIFK